VTSVALSSDGAHIVSGGKDNLVRVWDGRSGKDLLTLRGHTGSVTSVTTGGDGSRIVSCDSDGTAKVWDTQTGKCLLTFRKDLVAARKDMVGLSRANSIAMSEDGSFIVSGNDDTTVRMWGGHTGKELLTLRGHTDEVTAVAVSGDGSSIASSGDDRTVKLWDARSGKELLSLRGSRSIISLTWDLVTDVGLNRDGSRLVIRRKDGRVQVVDARTGKGGTLPNTGSGSGMREASSVAVSGDGSRIATGAEGGTVKVWDAHSRKELLILPGHTSPVSSVAVSGDGSRIVSGSADGTVKVWDGRTGKDLLTLRGHADRVVRVTISHEGARITSCTKDGTVKVWDARHGKDHLILREPSGWPGSVALSGDGTRIFAQSWRLRSKILAWDSTTGQLLPNAPSQMPATREEATSGDGKLQVSIDRDRICVYRTELEEARKQREKRDGDFLADLARFDPRWHEQQIDAALAADDDLAAAFHLERLVRGQPWDASLHVRYAHVLARQGRRQESTTHLAQALMLNPRVSLWSSDPKAGERGQKAAEAGDWPRAVRELQLAVHQPSVHAAFFSYLLLAQARTGDTPGAHTTMANLARRLARRNNPEARTLLLASGRAIPWQKGIAGLLLAQGKRNLARRRTDGTLDACGCALYRAGHFAEAHRVLDEAVSRGCVGDTWLFQAMAAKRLGKDERAAALLVKFERWRKTWTSRSWQERVSYDLLLDEARKLIRTPLRMPEIGEGE
jgi:WD40 repeat protein